MSLQGFGGWRMEMKSFDVVAWYMTKEILTGFDRRKHFEILSQYGLKNVGTTEKIRKCQKGESLLCFV